MKYSSRIGSKTQANTSPDLQMRNLNDNHLQFFNEKYSQNTTPFKMQRVGSINKGTPKLNNVKEPSSKYVDEISKTQNEQTQNNEDQEYTNSGNLIDVQNLQKRIQKMFQNHQNLKRQIVNEQTVSEHQSQQKIQIEQPNRRQSDIEQVIKEANKRNISISIKEERIYEDMHLGKAGNISSSNSSVRITEKTRTLNRNLNKLEQPEHALLTSHSSKYKNQNHQALQFQNNHSISQNNHQQSNNQIFADSNHLYHKKNQKPENIVGKILQYDGKVENNILQYQKSGNLINNNKGKFKEQLNMNEKNELIRQNRNSSNNSLIQNQPNKIITDKKYMNSTFDIQNVDKKMNQLNLLSISQKKNTNQFMLNPNSSQKNKAKYNLIEQNINSQTKQKQLKISVIDIKSNSAQKVGLKFESPGESRQKERVFRSEGLSGGGFQNNFNRTQTYGSNNILKLPSQHSQSKGDVCEAIEPMTTKNDQSQFMFLDSKQNRLVSQKTVNQLESVASSLTDKDHMLYEHQVQQNFQFENQAFIHNQNTQSQKINDYSSSNIRTKQARIEFQQQKNHLNSGHSIKKNLLQVNQSQKVFPKSESRPKKIAEYSDTNLKQNNNETMQTLSTIKLHQTINSLQMNNSSSQKHANKNSLYNDKFQKILQFSASKNNQDQSFQKSDLAQKSNKIYKNSSKFNVLNINQIQFLGQNSKSQQTLKRNQELQNKSTQQQSFIQEKQIDHEIQFLNQMSLIQQQPKEKKLSIKQTNELKLKFENFIEHKQQYLTESQSQEFKNLKIQLIDHTNQKIQQYLLFYIIQNCQRSEIANIVLKAALEKGISTKVTNQYGEGALHQHFKKLSSINQNNQLKKDFNDQKICCLVTTLLIKFGADTNLVSANGTSVLHQSVQRNLILDSCQCIHLLIHSQSFNLKEQFNLLNFSGLSALHLAIRFNHSFLVKFLIENGADSCLETLQGLKPIHVACQMAQRQNRGPKEILEILIIELLENSHSFKLNEKSSGGMDPMDFLIQDSNNGSINFHNSDLFECVQLLIGIGHQVSQKHINKMKYYQKSNEFNLNSQEKIKIGKILEIMERVMADQKGKQVLNGDSSSQSVKNSTEQMNIGGTTERSKSNVEDFSSSNMIIPSSSSPIVTSSFVVSKMLQQDQNEPTKFHLQNGINSSLQSQIVADNIHKKSKKESEILRKINQTEILFDQKKNNEMKKEKIQNKSHQDEIQTPILSSLPESKTTQQQLPSLNQHSHLLITVDDIYSRYTTNQNLDEMRMEMMHSLDNNSIQQSIQIQQDLNLNSIINQSDQNNRESMIDAVINSRKQRSVEKHHGMHFEVIINKKREQVLQIIGFKEKETEMGEDSDEIDNNQTLFVNLNRIFIDQNKQNKNEIDLIQNPLVQLNKGVHVLDGGKSVAKDLKNYLTENPMTKALNGFPMKMYQHQIQEIEVKELIGEGSHAKVYKANYFGQVLALKEYNNDNQASINAFIGELEAIYIDTPQSNQPFINGSMLSHPSVVQVIGAYQKGGKSYLLTEFSSYGNLLEFLKNNDKIYNQDINVFKMKIQISLQIAQGLMYLHRHAQVFHRDLKAENILVCQYNPQSLHIQVKLSDFGVSKRFCIQKPLNKTEQKISSSPPSAENYMQIIEGVNGEGNRTQTLGTIPWMAPEFIEKRIFTQQSDIYSFGILLYEIFYPVKKENGKWQKNISPYQNLQAVQIMYQVVNDGLRPNLQIFDEIKDKFQYSEIINLMKRCWNEKFNERPNSLQLIQILNKINTKV